MTQSCMRKVSMGLKGELMDERILRDSREKLVTGEREEGAGGAGLE